MRQLQILFNSAKTWHGIVCWFLCFSLNLPELIIKLFWTSFKNNFMISSGKFGEKHRNQQTITCQVLAELNKIWSCLIFIKLYPSTNPWHFLKKILRIGGIEKFSFFLSRPFWISFFKKKNSSNLIWRDFCLNEKKNVWK